MEDDKVERRRVELVFALTGGELHERSDRFPDEWDGVFAYWYEGAPDYCQISAEEFKCRTAIVCRIYGALEAPSGWREVGCFMNSGEAECWCADDDGHAEDDKCPLCEGDGFVYIGEGYCEVVYERIGDDED